MERHSSINLQISGLGYVYHSAATSTHVRRYRMVALLCNNQRNGTITKTKQKHNAKRKEAKSAEERRKERVIGEAIITIIEKKNPILRLLEFRSSYPFLAPVAKTPRGDGWVRRVRRLGAGGRQRKRRFFLLVLSVKMLQSCVQSIPSLTGCWRKRRGAADVTGPRDTFLVFCTLGFPTFYQK